MLELRHLTKIYKTAGGAETRAIDGVSLSFESTGLVFLLGKSGSGKSTLLNLAGGLDAPTEGEVLVMGRSSKVFSGRDFDSYRNTYVGFVFQEYNVLNEFNVEENVALALELQGRPRDRKRVLEILEEVDLAPYAKRRPGTLSGGQKQRVAIARALVKDPQIIMADEPSGALDSATGKQVFETLKKLSRRRLVLVVSHDREFAEIYGDRIIELKDGKVLSDVTKKRQAATLDRNAIKHGDNTVTLKHGTPVSDATIEFIREFLEKSTGEILLSRDEGDILRFKRASRIDETGARETFFETPPPVPYEGESVRFIRSRLPAARAVKIGASSLRLKPFRLLLTVLLSIIAFVMFGLFSTMILYNGERVLARSFLESEYDFLTLNKVYETRVSGSRNSADYAYDTAARFTPAEIASFGETAFGAYTLGGLTPSNLDLPRNSILYRPTFTRVAAIPKEHPLTTDMVGAYPALPNQIAVSEYFLECAQNAVFTRVSANGAASGVKEINRAEDLVGEYLKCGDLVFQISGVFRGGALFEKYRALEEDDSDWLMRLMLEMHLSEGTPTLTLVSEQFLDLFEGLIGGLEEDHTKEIFDYAENPFDLVFTDSGDAFTNSTLKIFHSNEIPFPVTYFGQEKTALSANEFIVPSYYLSVYYEAHHGSSPEEQQAYEAFVKQMRIWAEGRISVTNGAGATVNREATEAEIAAAEIAVTSYVATHPMAWRVKPHGEAARSATVVGAYRSVRGHQAESVLCSQEFYEHVGGYPGPLHETNYVPEADASYSWAFVPLEKTEKAFGALSARLGAYDEADVAYLLHNVLYENVTLVNSIVEALSALFLGAGIVLAFFASLLLFNFITVSITSKKKEIGILRALGARGADVFKIFFAESGIIVGACTLISIVGTAAATALLNGILRAAAGIDVTLFVFGPFSAIVMLSVAVVVAFLSTFLPAYFTARKKPVESIRAL